MREQLKAKYQIILLTTANVGLLLVALILINHIVTFKSSVREIVREELAVREQQFVERYADQVASFMTDIGVEGTTPKNAEEMLQAYLSIVLGSVPPE